MENHIIITPTSFSNGGTKEIKIPRFGSKEDIKSEEKVDSKKLQTDTNDTRVNSALESQSRPNATWDQRQNESNIENMLAQTFLNECETLEQVITNLLTDIDADKQTSLQQKHDKKLELIRYVWDELSQRRTQGAVCRIFGYISQIYESHLKQVQSKDKMNSSPSAYEILLQENKNLKAKYEQEKKRTDMIIKELNEKVQKMKEQEQAEKEKPPKEKPQKKGQNDQADESESDIFEGLSESKKDRIMSEVAELYEANIALQIENKMLKKQLRKTQGIKILDSQESDYNDDSMNCNSEIGISHEMLEHFSKEKYVWEHSFTDNEELGYSHISDATGSIHNVWIDPTDESYKKAVEREKNRKKPAIIPMLDFNLLENRPDLITKKLKPKNELALKIVKKSNINKPKNHSLSNRTADERISFSVQKGGDLDTSEIEVTLDQLEQMSNSTENHMLIQEVNTKSKQISELKHPHLSQMEMVCLKTQFPNEYI